MSWLVVAGKAGLVFYVPSLAVTEAQMVYPQAGPVLAELLSDPVVVLGELDAQIAAAVADLLENAGVFDPLGGWVVHASRTRGWPVLTEDQGGCAGWSLVSRSSCSKSQPKVFSFGSSRDGPVLLKLRRSAKCRVRAGHGVAPWAPGIGIHTR